MRIKEKYNKKLLVEGNDDQHVIWALCNQFSIIERFDVIDCGGIENLIDQIPIRLKQSNIETIGIIIDADSDLQLRWRNLKQLLNAQGFVLPELLPENGLILSQFENISIGIWIMPDNNLNGMLEDFIQFLVPPDDSLFPIILENLNEIERKQLNKYKQLHKSKAIIHSWLSVQDDPGTPLGLSITKKYLTTDNNTCKKLIDWLNNLFS
jgi:hypothetical protein